MFCAPEGRKRQNLTLIDGSIYFKQWRTDTPVGKGVPAREKAGWNPSWRQGARLKDEEIVAAVENYMWICSPSLLDLSVSSRTDHPVCTVMAVTDYIWN